MKWFYVISLVAVAGLALLPLMYLRGQAEDEYAGRVVLYDSYGSAVKSVDPATCGDTTSAWIQGNVYEGLYCYHWLKRPLEVIPQLAAEMPEISEDGLTYTIKIKPGVEYQRNPCFGKGSDGSYKTRTVRAEDFVLACKRVADYHVNTGLAWAFLSNRVVGLDEFREKTKKLKIGDFSRYELPVAGVKALDEHTFQIRLLERFPQFLYVLAMSVYAPIPREAVDYWLATEDDGSGGRRQVPLEKRSTEFREAEMVVGTGPYILKTFRRKARIVLERNPHFRDEYYPGEGGPGDKEAGLLADAGKKVPFIDVLHYDFVSETYSAWMLFLTRRNDASGIPKEVFESVITLDKSLAEKWTQRGIRLMKYESPAVYWLVFNMEDPVMGASKSLRHALCLSFDVENNIKVLWNGRGKRPVNILPSSFKTHAAAGPGPYFKLDLAAAREKIEQARKELAAAGKLKNGKIPQLKLDMGDRGHDAHQFGEFCQHQFKKVGVELKVIYNDWPGLQEKVHNKQTQIYTMGWHADYPDAENFLQLYYSGNIDKGTNNSNYSRPDFDRLYEKIRVMPDTPERTEMCARMVRMIGEDCPILPIREPMNFVLIHNWVKNVKPHPIGYGFQKYRRIDTALRKKMGGR